MIIKYNIEDFTDISSMEDFYRKLGIWNDMGKTIFDVSQLHMEKENCEILQEYIYNTIRLKSRFKGLADRIPRSVASMDWLNFSPVSNPDMPKDEIWIDELSPIEIAEKKRRLED
ncbi:hypothetical protein SDC9_167274 [bioreactor metagenome]|uniref:Uncharacterized protein n=1 Tax=bioreactor metagenome TaxID=1076179 RepID=A0A645G254_9ZZZZ